MEELRKISASEVARHTSKDDCWLIIHGKVYDVTKFLDDHPGGKEVLVHTSGLGDATQTFEDVGHSKKARSRMSNYVIGVLEGYDPSKALESRKRRSKARGEGAAKVQDQSLFRISDILLPLFILVVATLAGYWLNNFDA